MIQPTSQLAFLEVLPTLGDRHQEVLKYLAIVDNATNSEIGAALKWSINRVTPRVHELRQKNLVEQAAERACKITGRKVIAWRAVVRKPAPANSPTNFRCHYCPKTASLFVGDTPRCEDHRVVISQGSLV